MDGNRVVHPSSDAGDAEPLPQSIALVKPDHILVKDVGALGAAPRQFESGGIRICSQRNAAPTSRSWPAAT